MLNITQDKYVLKNRPDFVGYVQIYGYTIKPIDLLVMLGKKEYLNEPKDEEEDYAINIIYDQPDILKDFTKADEF